jgi:hypothetical protein
MNSAKVRIALIVITSTVAIGTSSPAAAGGCNGVVNIFTWGCAPWDNNNGRNFPYYRKKAASIPVQGTQIVRQNG